MTYKLKFVPAAWEEWGKLDGSVKELFKAQLASRLENPIRPGSRLRNELDGCYKIKLLKSGYRLVYFVNEEEKALYVLSVGKREGAAAYKAAIENGVEILRKRKSFVLFKK